MPRTRHLTIPVVGCGLALTVLQLRAEGLEIAIDPPVASLNSVFAISLVNASSVAYTFPCSAVPVITPVGEDRLNINCPSRPLDCGVPTRVALLRPGESLSYQWRPREDFCFPYWPVSPGVYEVRWQGFPVDVVTRVELLPDPGRTLQLGAGPPEAIFGEPVGITLVNTLSSTLYYDQCEGPVSILDPRGLPAVCTLGPLCTAFRVDEVAPGASWSWTWVPGKDACAAGLLPGRHRLIWEGFVGSYEDRQWHSGETSVLVLPPPDRRLELTLSASEVRQGDVLRITATNPLDVSVWYDFCCSDYDPTFIDGLGRESPCFPCVRGCMGQRELPPGGSLSIDRRVPGPEDCGLAPGRWSVAWGKFSLAPGPAPPVFGYAELQVLPPTQIPIHLRGDCDQSLDLEMSDAVRLLGYLFLGESEPPCLEACDSDDSGDLDLTDAVRILAFLFLGGQAPELPFPVPGPDPTPDGLGCKR